ncbi:MAG: mercury resistance system periplasmic binding protein MerP [bacterium]
MKRLIAIAALTAAFCAPAWAEIQTVTLSVPGMTCAACPITVKRALSRVDGVESVVVDFGHKQATVVFDDARTTVQALTQATANAGYPSSPQLSGEAS